MRDRGYMRLAALLLTMLATAAEAEVIRMQPDFTFRRVSAPNRGALPQITVQVDPTAPRLDPIYAPPSVQEMRARSQSESPAPRVTGAVDWFWEEISPALEGGPSDRFSQALVHLANAPERQTVRAPRLQTLQTIAELHGVDTRISPALVLAIIAVESAGRHDAQSHAGAQGLMQLMPATAARFGVNNSFDTAQNIRGGVEYLVWLQEHFGGDPILMLAGYNAGEGNVSKHGGVPPFAETRAYVPKVLAAWEVARGLCRTRPELPTDGCVFVTGS